MGEKDLKMNEDNFHKDFLKGLKALVETTFPKKCNTCGKTFDTEEEFLYETERLNPTHSGLKEARDDDDYTILEVYRNCTCGSTLMDFFTDRRDNSVAGSKRRAKFGDLLDLLENNGLDRNRARNEIFNVIHGKKSELIKKRKT